ncbi:MAG: hypothetical protein NW226_18910 [Microscillaceae bacterium]|nr:hypothetical protein [Microscillaceae bacterium]
MLESTQTVFSMVARTGFRILRSLVFIMGLAVLLNWSFVVVYPFVGKNIYLEFWAMMLLVIAVFGLLIPYIYYLTSLRFLPQIALSHLYQANARLIFEYMVHKVFEQREEIKVEEFVEKLQSKQLGGPMIRWVYGFLLKKAPWLEVIQEISQEVALKRENTNQIVDRLEAKSDELIPLDMLKAGYGWFYFYLLLNGGLMVGFVYFV